MASKGEPSFTIGLEEEYLLVDLKTRDLVADPPQAFMKACEEALPKRVSPEFLRCQIEVGTNICQSTQGARRELGHLRATIAAKAREHGMAPIAASTHPFARWKRQSHTDRDRYNALAADLQVVVRRLMICGMHVHVEIADDAARIDIFNQLSYFLPHLLALSTSSPYWQGQPTGLKSYRLSVFNEMPRTGLPETFESPGEYQRAVKVLVDTGVIEDATKIWWDLRPSHRFPTLEMRITDVCTRLDDAIAIAAVYRCLARMLYRLRRDNQRWRQYSRLLLAENRWLAQRHGAKGDLIDFGHGALVPFAELASDILALIREDATHFNCEAAIQHVRAITTEGTSADRQIKTFNLARADGADEEEAFRAVVDMLIAETQQGCEIID